MDLQTLIGEPWADYGLIDSGYGRKLERYGRFRFIRPEAQALWAPASPDWKAHGEFVPGSDEDGGGRWEYSQPVPREGWPLKWDDVSFNASNTPFHHLGFFPDMAPVWSWVRERVAGLDSPECMNLFGYTGVGTLAMAANGAKMVHVDASKKSVEAARGNATLSGLNDAPVRWLIDDAAKFVAREVRRGRRYDGILLDPPKYGRGPTGEVWRLFEDMPALLKDCAALLADDASFLLLNAYAARVSGLSLAHLMAEATHDRGGRIDWGELALSEDAQKDGSDARAIGLSFFARWSSDVAK